MDPKLIPSPQFIEFSFISSHMLFLTFRKVEATFEGDERFNAVERARDREDLFESYVVELRKKVWTPFFQRFTCCVQGYVPWFLLLPLLNGLSVRKCGH